ncbi:MAG: hypothetical protein L6Q29_00605 [Candidatus Pacebacteria bacterium]|nr:hypothetical protein [Candidatus Paceibacterota bacterium]NUQ57045.1 hypothetical protein [Candidatus Paceibacter sp.]
MSGAKDKNIYVKKIEKIRDYNVWLVDGQYVRKVINENFVEYDHHYNHSFVPKRELWIDEETNPEERKFFINHMFVEMGLIKVGEGYDEAVKKADFFEKKEREAENNKNHFRAPKNRKELLETVRKKILEESGEKIKIWLVDGKLVRDFFLVEYAEGGHDKVYSFIPKNEIWIDEVLSPEERKFIILHELRERFLMSLGKKYSEAHKSATLVEDYYRDHEDKLEERIKEEIQNSDK